MVMEGNLQEGVLPGLLRDIYVARRTGLLHFSQGNERRSVRFRRGHIIHGDTNVKEEWMGEVLVRQGLLSRDDLKRATGFVLRDGKRLGAVLIEMGALDQGRLEDAVAVHVRELLLKVFSWTEGTYSFEESEPGEEVETDLTLKLSTGEMILEAVRRVEDPDLVRYALGDIDRILGLSSDPLLRFQRIALSPVDGFVLSRVDGTLSAREIIQLAPVSTEEAQRSLFGLLCTGVVEYLPLPPKPKPAPQPRPARLAPAPTPAPEREAPAPAAAPPVPPAAASLEPAATSVPEPAPDRTPLNDTQAARRQEILDAFEGLKLKNHFEVLGITTQSGEAQVKEAYFRLAKRFHPDAHHDPALAGLKDKLEAVFIRLGEAYEVLRNTKTRSSYEADLKARMPKGVPLVPTPGGGAAPAVDRGVEQKVAEEAVRRAEKLYEEQKYWDAIQLLEAALPKLKAKMLARGRVALAKCFLKNPNWVRRAEEVLQKAVQEDAAHLEAYWQLAQIYKAGGLKTRTVSMLRKVLELNPEHEEAAADLAALAPAESQAPAAEGGNLLKKLFGKG
jgi:tetratricopeptide (TPR) repeat protein